MYRRPEFLLLILMEEEEEMVDESLATCAQHINHLHVMSGRLGAATTLTTTAAAAAAPVYSVQDGVFPLILL